MNKQKIIVVCGPTATGKSDFAVALAKKIGGEIISADSRQVYRELDIGSGKITPEEMQGIPHHMLDIASPRRTFSVVQYQKKATKAIRDIVKRGNTPIICGGTGLYIDAVVYDTVFPAVKPNAELRKKLSQNTAIANFRKLEQLDPERAAVIDPHNNARLIRAIEIATALGSVPKLQKTLSYDVEWHYLDFPDDVLKERIHARLIKRMGHGMVEEVERLHADPPSARSGGGGKVSWKRLESLGLEYRYLALYLQGKLSKDDMLIQLELAIWHYAKRQRTWFKKYGK